MDVCTWFKVCFTVSFGMNAFVITSATGPGSVAIPKFGNKSVVPQSCASTIGRIRSEEHTSELQSQSNLVCRLLLEKKKGVRSLVSDGEDPPDPHRRQAGIGGSRP